MKASESIVLSFLFLLVLGGMVFPQAQALSFTQTRYFTTDNVYTYKGAMLQGFQTYQGIEGEGYNYGYPAGTWNATANTKFQFGIRAWLYEYNATDVGDELTGGSPKAVVERTSAGEGMQNATWTSALTNLTRTQSLVIKLYARRFAVIWFGWFPIVGQLLPNPSAAFFSEGLGMAQILSTSWNVYYYTAFRTAGTYKWAEYYWGNSTYNSRTENIQLNDGVLPPTTPINQANLLLTGSLLTIPIMLAFALAYRKKHKP